MSNTQSQILEFSGGRNIFGFNEQILGACLWSLRICLVARETNCVIRKLEFIAASSNLEEGEGVKIELIANDGQYNLSCLYNLSLYKDPEGQVFMN